MQNFQLVLNVQSMATWRPTGARICAPSIPKPLAPGTDGGKARVLCDDL